MFRNFEEVKDRAREIGPVIMSVAVAQDEELLRAVGIASEGGIARGVLFGDEKLIRPMLKRVGLPEDTEIHHEADESRAALMAVAYVREGEAQVLMKGFVNTSIFVRAILDREVGLRTGRLLSHLAVFEIPGEEKLVFQTDGGINVAPDLDQKRQILENSLLALHSMGIVIPKVAILTANERVSDKMPATVDAAELVRMAKKGDLPPCIVEGPIAMDVALSADRARHKGIESEVSGDVDLFLVPNIEAGNMVGKTLVHYTHARMAGLVLGATAPVILTSRSHSAEEKLNSIALASLAAVKNGLVGM